MMVVAGQWIMGSRDLRYSHSSDEYAGQTKGEEPRGVSTGRKNSKMTRIRLKYYFGGIDVKAVYWMGNLLESK
jgi:hypothetical protein